MSLNFEEKQTEYELKLMKELEQFDTPTIANIVATYPANVELCLGLYHPAKSSWYTDQSLRCIYPEMGVRCGYAVTAVYGLFDPAFTRLGFVDILEAIDESPKPVVLALKGNFGEIQNKNAILGGNMMTAFKKMGVTAVLGDAPTRDVDEMRPMGVQCLFPGVVAGHATSAVEAVNVPVKIADMDIAPREVIHMDENGAVKFPARHLEEILEKAKKLRAQDEKRQSAMSQTTDPKKLADIMKGLYQ